MKTLVKYSFLMLLVVTNRITQCSVRLNDPADKTDTLFGLGKLPQEEKALPLIYLTEFVARHNHQLELLEILGKKDKDPIEDCVINKNSKTFIPRYDNDRNLISRWLNALSESPKATPQLVHMLEIIKLDWEKADLLNNLAVILAWYGEMSGTTSNHYVYHHIKLLYPDKTAKTTKIQRFLLF